jgi:hypothetical protein
LFENFQRSIGKRKERKGEGEREREREREKERESLRILGGGFRYKGLQRARARALSATRHIFALTIAFLREGRAKKGRRNDDE